MDAIEGVTRTSEFRIIMPQKIKAASRYSSAPDSLPATLTAPAPALFRRPDNLYVGSAAKFTRTYGNFDRTVLRSAVPKPVEY